MKLVEMYVDEEDLEHGIDAVSIVSSPAIESSYVALKGQPIELAEVDKKKQVLMGALLIPNKPILRRDEETGEEYYIHFSSNTVRKCLKLMMQRGKMNNTTLEHEVSLEGNTVIEAWLKEDLVHDKSALYGLKDPVGSLMISLYVPDKKQYEEYAKSKTGFSLEGYFTDKLQMKSVKTEDKIINEIREILSNL